MGVYSATTVQGVVLDQETKTPIAKGTVTLGNAGISVRTNARGEYTFPSVEVGEEELIIEADGYVSDIEVVNIDAEPITLNVVLRPDVSYQAKEELLVNLSEVDLNDDEGKTQSQSSNMSASQDVFNSISSFAWSTVRYRARGYEQTYEQNYIGGLSFNAMERGTFNFSAMGGLNDASRYKEIVNSMESNNFTFGGIGASTNYLMNAQRYAKGWKVNLGGTNRNYKIKASATYATGPLKNGWAFAAQVGWRFSPYIDNKGIIGEGIAYNSIGAFFTAEKNWGSDKRLTLIALASSANRGQSAAVTQEVYDLVGSINYNPYWGYQDGKVRNSRVVKSIDPTVIGTFEWKVNDQHALRFGLGIHYNFYSNSALTFYNAPDPRPDYYRNLPSALWDGQINSDGKFIKTDMNGKNLGKPFVGWDGQKVGSSVDEKKYNELVQLWKDRDDQTTQIDWDALYGANYMGNKLNPEGSAKYILERRHNDIGEVALNVFYTYDSKKHLKVTVGLDGKYGIGVHYKTVDDLLGGKQWIDVDAFSERDIKELATNIGLTQDDVKKVKQNNIFNPNQKVGEDDKFGYRYNIDMAKVTLWAQNDWSYNFLDFYYALGITYSEMTRSTSMINGRAWYLAQLNPKRADIYLGPDYKSILNAAKNGSGSPKTWFKGYDYNFVDPAFKLGLTYKINGRNRIKVNALAATQAPLARDAYIAPRVHDRVIAGMYKHNNANSLKDYYAADQKIVSADLTYEFNFPIVRGRITGFYTQFWNGTELNGYYDDEARTYVNQSITGIDRRHFGGEVALSVKCGTYITITGATSVGDYRYISNADAITSAENGMALATNSLTGKPIFELKDKVLMNGLHVSTGPQVNASIKVSFFHPKMWFADVTLSYFDWNYLDFAPSRRMQGLYTDIRSDKSNVNGSYEDIGAVLKDDKTGEPICDKYGTPKLKHPYNKLSDQESLVADRVWDRFVIDASVGKLIYFKNGQSLSVNLNLSNLSNNTHLKTGGYQQARLPRQTKQGVSEKDGNSVISPNVWKFPSKYYYAWGTNFYLSLTYKF